MKTRARLLIIALAAIALIASITALYVHYRMLQDPTYSSFCDVSETVSCEAVLESPYAWMFGMPVATGAPAIRVTGIISILVLVRKHSFAPDRSDKV